MSEKEMGKKEPTVKTLEDKGTKTDFVDFGDGRQVFIYREEKFRGIQVGGFRLGWSEKYKIGSPDNITMGTISTLSKQVSELSGSAVSTSDFEVMKEGSALPSSLEIKKESIEITKEDKS
jgi:hypothetical protein